MKNRVTLLVLSSCLLFVGCNQPSTNSAPNSGEKGAGNAKADDSKKASEHNDSRDAKDGKPDSTAGQPREETKTDEAPPQPASSPRFDTPGGYYAGAGVIGEKVKVQVLRGFTNDKPRYETRELKANQGEVFIYIRLHAAEAIKQKFDYDKCELVAGATRRGVVAETVKLPVDLWEGVFPKTWRDETKANQATYLLFAVPRDQPQYRFEYASTGVEIKLLLAK